MFRLRPLATVILLGAVASALAGCDTMGIDFGGPSTPATPPARAIDYANDDLASLVFAVDVPASLKPIPAGSIATFDATNDKAGRHVKAALTLTDGDAVDSALPALPAGRTYYLLGFTDKDKTGLRDAQKWLKSLPADAAPVTALQVTPRFCAVGTVEPATTQISIVPALPSGGALLPLVTAEPVSALDNGASIKPCAG